MAKATRRRAPKRVTRKRKARAAKPRPKTQWSVATRLERQRLYDTHFKGDTKEYEPQDFTNADLSERAVSSEDLHVEGLTGLLRFIDAKGVRYLYTVDGYPMLIVRHDKRTMVRHGCHWFTLREAMDWWQDNEGGSYESSGNRWEEREDTRHALDRIVKFCRLHGWPTGL